MSAPTLLSIQVGLPMRRGTVGSKDFMSHPWQSGIFKSPISGPVWLGTLNLAGDGQADLKNHGGPGRAVLSYSAAHYAVWRDELAQPDWPYGAFGENFTITELDETSVCIGDIYAIGDVVQVQVTQPRQPCWKLARRWQRKDLTARVQEKGWGGWYQRVLQEGEVEAGMTVRLVDRPFPQFPVIDVYALMNQWLDDPEAMLALSECDALAEGWREVFTRRLKEASDA